MNYPGKAASFRALHLSSTMHEARKRAQMLGRYGPDSLPERMNLVWDDDVWAANEARCIDVASECERAFEARTGFEHRET